MSLTFGKLLVTVNPIDTIEKSATINFYGMVLDVFFSKIFIFLKVSNFVGILSNGLRIAPPEAPHNGYAYGKGLYFANSFNTSACYCSGPGNERLIILCESALGKIGHYQGNRGFGLFNASNDSSIYLLDGYDSCLGFAMKTFPDNSFKKHDTFKIPVKTA